MPAIQQPFTTLAALGMLLAASMPIASAAEPAEGDSPAVVSKQIDELFQAAWDKAGIQPALPDDAMFLRRVYLDLTGVIPTVSETRAFLADEQPDKRARLVEDLLARPRHATRMASLWRHVMLPRGGNEFAAQQFQGWLEREFRDHTPYDALVRELLTARGTAGQSPAVIYYDALGLKPEELAASMSQVFLGVQIRCAQCHDHPFAAWKQDDFWGLAAFFGRLPQAEGVAATGLEDLPSGEVQHPKTNVAVIPRYPDGTAWTFIPEETRRLHLASWTVSADNPYFARAAVNRLWSMLLGRGLIEPVDDLGDHNPTRHAEALELLASDFATHGYDLRRVLRVLAGTRLYQQTSDASPEQSADPTLFARMPVRSLSAEQIYDCLVKAAGQRDPLDPNDTRRMAARQAFLTQFDAPTQKATELQAGIPQALAMLNGPLVEELVDPSRSDLVVAVSDSPFFSDEQRIEALFLATLSRPPRPEELTLLRERLAARGAADRPQALSDLLWALVNSSEFIVNR